MKIESLSNHETVRLGGATTRVIITHEDLTETVANTAQTIALLTVALGDQVKCVAAQMVEDFSDASDAAFNTTAVTVGDGGSATRFLASMQLNVNGTEVDALAGVDTFYAYAAADTVDLFVGSMTGKSLVNIDTGELHLYFAHVKFPRRLQT